MQIRNMKNINDIQLLDNQIDSSKWKDFSWELAKLKETYMHDKPTRHSILFIV